MPLISDKVKRLFDTNSISRGCAIRVKRGDEVNARMGLVREVSAERLRILYSNVQNGAISYFDIPASEVGAGMWEIVWTKDLEEVFLENGQSMLPPPPPPLEDVP